MGGLETYASVEAPASIADNPHSLSFELDWLRVVHLYRLGLGRPCSREALQRDTGSAPAVSGGGADDGESSPRLRLGSEFGSQEYHLGRFRTAAPPLELVRSASELAPCHACEVPPSATRSPPGRIGKSPV